MHRVGVANRPGSAQPTEALKLLPMRRFGTCGSRFATAAAARSSAFQVLPECSSNDFGERDAVVLGTTSRFGSERWIQAN